MSARLFTTRRFFSLQPHQHSTKWQQYKPYIVTYTTVGVCCSGYAYNLYADDQIQKGLRKRGKHWHRSFIDKHLIFTRDNYNAGRWWTLVTYSFMHPSLFHLAVNMFAFTSFGPMAIGIFGVRSVAAIWLGGSVSGMYFSMLGDDYKNKQANSGRSWLITEIGGRPLPPRAERASATTQHVGSSASLLGIVTAVACRIPRQSVYFIPIPKAIPIYGAIGGFAVFSAIAYAQELVPFMGHSGHLGGMAFGMAYYVLALRKKRFPRR